ncbi:MAG TPA: hypothetical protein VHL85_05030 [Burkholderiales bacterium]|jgi:hypothetical protein|nr:hypothetical protein [Burkholderiales bacterium]
MNPIRHVLFVALALCACAATAGESLRFDVPAGLYGAAQTPAVFYSFSDVYRLTVSGPEAVPEAPGGAFADFPMRVVAAEAPPPGYAFSISGVKQPERGLLLLAGLALAAWVARRRLLQAI